jgi:hypothetical protein
MKLKSYTPYLCYTWLEEWYGKLGYQTIYRFKMGKKM